MNSTVGTLVLLAVVAAVLMFAFRGCKQMNVHQTSNDDRSTLTVDIEKKHHHHHHDEQE